MGHEVWELFKIALSKKKFFNSGFNAVSIIAEGSVVDSSGPEIKVTGVSETTSSRPGPSVEI
ncbi:hypothetical protein TCAL_17144 [Tigriopus californicus]|uniref:Uncharacterized protein n=1 Tax=Tigriopus californicus TaxID=6832 RepID=A0A553P2P8_TIGCA|nr:hypothetical protein TCAL_17144 [Tigriopus californicus]